MNWRSFTLLYMLAAVICYCFVYRRDVLSDDNLSRQREISREERKLKAIKQKVSSLTQNQC